jgi:hydroxymethylbilane synthase
VPLRIATRGSELALWQARHVATLLGGGCELVVVETTGDQRLDQPIWELGGKGVFVKEVQRAVLDGRADLAVHSAKDLPSDTPDGLLLAAVPERGDARDALVGSTLAGLPEGATVATGSRRRQVQLAGLRPDLAFVGLRGNMATRLAKAAEVDAIVVAAVALERLGLAHHLAETFGVDVLVPQVGQGALAVECRSNDRATLAALVAIEHGPSRAAVDAERAFLATLGGDCDLPAGAHATVDDGWLTLTGVLAADESAPVARHTASGGDPLALGAEVASRLLSPG